MIRWNDRWLYLPDDIREEVARQNLAPGKRNFPLAPYAFHPGNCPCLVCAWVREQNAQRGQHVPDSQRAVCGHERGCRCSLCVAQRIRIAAGKQEAAKLIEMERARRKAVADTVREQIQASTPEPAWRPRMSCTCLRCRQRRRELALEKAGKQDTPGSGADADAIEVTALGNRVPADPAGEVEAALRDFDAWHAAGRGTLPEPEPLPAGICRLCHLSMAVTSCPPGIASGLCFWCDLADTVRAQGLARAREAAAGGKHGTHGTRPWVMPVIAITAWVIVILVVAGVL